MSLFAPLLLALVGATPTPDGGPGEVTGALGFADPLYSQCREAPEAFQAPDAGPEGPWIMPYERVQRLGCLMATCETDRALKSQHLSDTPPPPSWVAWGAGLMIAALLGFATGALFHFFEH